MKNILLYGGTGLVGAHLAALLSARAETERIFLLTETANDDRARARVRRLTDFLSPHEAKIELLDGNVQSPGFGLSASTWENLSNVIDTAFCCSDRKQPMRDLNTAQQSCVEPLENWLSLVSSIPRLRLCYVSTAFVAGRRRGLFTECDLDCGQTFNSPWERGMFEAECRLRSSPDSERITIFRPSHVIGDSQSGVAFVLTGLYAFLRHLRERQPRMVVGDALARLDVVPVDYVVNAIIAASERPAASKTFHLVAGWQKSMPSKEFVREVTASVNGKSANTRLIPPVAAVVLHANNSDELAFYRNCLSQPTVFDDYCARAVLEKLGISCPPLGSYLEKVLQFAESHKWQENW